MTPDSTPQVHGDEQTPPTRPQGAWEQIEALAALLEPEAFDPRQQASEVWRKVTQNRALAHAAAVLAAGYVRVEVAPWDDEQEAMDFWTAMQAAAQGQAGHWPTVAWVLREEVLRLRRGLGLQTVPGGPVRGSVSGGGNADR
jgi:hypothetical protein